MSNQKSIGEHYGGGIVFWVDKSGQHGLIAATADESTKVDWNGAVRLCGRYQGGGYSNWYLPSKDELNLLNRQKNVVGGFGYGHYWSSTEHSSGSAWYQSFDKDYQGDASKDHKLWVRAVRAF